MVAQDAHAQIQLAGCKCHSGGGSVVYSVPTAGRKTPIQTVAANGPTLASQLVSPAFEVISQPVPPPPSPEVPIDGEIWSPTLGEGEILLQGPSERHLPEIEDDCFACGFLPGPDPYSLGLGASRVPWATFEIEPARPTRMIQIEFDSLWNIEFPDRLEYYWARIAAPGPANVETDLDMSELRFHIETGGSKFSLITEHVLRSVDPEANGNSVGYGDMSIGTKLVVYEGDTSIFTYFQRTHIPTGVIRRGLGANRVALEHALLMDVELSCVTHMHGILDWWINISGDPMLKGTFIKYGLGFTHLLYERPYSDFAIIPSLEFVGWSIVDGAATVATDTIADIDADGIFSIHAGTRVLVTHNCELGFGTSTAITTNHWYENQFRIDLRILY
ncbi:MAG: hypothetical protein N2C14_15370 [Planctomycetales bacterium]